MQRLLVVIVLSFLCLLKSHAQTNCELPERAFSVGEVLEYRVQYNWGMVWLESAWARFSVKRGSSDGRSCLYFRGEGNTHSKYDWFFRVRDLFETWTDSVSLRPIKFAAQVNEGSKHDRHLYIFDDRRDRAYTIITRGGKKTSVDTVRQGACTVDVLSAIYHARCFDYSHCKVNDTISMSQLIDGKVYAIYVRYLGREEFRTEKHGSFSCIKFSPLLVEGSIFRKGEGMTVWVTDDENKLPLYIETPIIIGTIKVSLQSFSGLRYPLKARIR